MHRSMRAMFGVSCAFVVLVFAVVGCSPSPAVAPNKTAVRSTIRRYNDLLAAGYRSMNMNPMLEVATRAQAESEYVHMSSLAEGGVRLDPELREMKFIRVSVEETSAQVETKETWDYRHYNRVDGKLLLEQKGLVYDMAYDLETQSDGRWLVSDVRTISASSTVPPEVIATPTAVAPGR